MTPPAHPDAHAEQRHQLRNVLQSIWNVVALLELHAPDERIRELTAQLDVHLRRALVILDAAPAGQRAHSDEIPVGTDAASGVDTFPYASKRK